MTEKKFKCNKCGESESHFPIKGSNNTKLCYRCGANICFKCGKKENLTQWIEDEDCCGNKRMREAKIYSFHQREKERNDLENSWEVVYCSEHKEEAQKNPNKWTEEDGETWYKRRQQEEQERIAQEIQEREERLNKQKNLFYWEVEVAKDKNGEEYEIFRGKENGNDYYLMVPCKHPLWDMKTTDPATKELIIAMRHEAFYLVLIEGVENIPVGKSPSDYWQWRPEKTINFHKLVKLTDKITIAEAGESPQKDKPVENELTDNFSKSAREIREFLLQYFKTKNIKAIKLENKSLIIEYNDNSSTTNLLTNFPDLKGVDQYLQKKSDKTISRSELELNNNSDATPPTTKPRNNALWIGCGIGGVAIITVILGLWLKRRNRIKKS